MVLPESWKLQKKAIVNLVIIFIISLIILILRPEYFIEGVQTAALYAAITLPFALVLGIVDIVNLAHGDFMMLGAYAGYILYNALGMDPLVSMIPSFFIMFFIGIIVFIATFKHVLKAPILNQMLLAFGVMICIEQIAEIIWTSRFVSVGLSYVSANVTIKKIDLGIFTINEMTIGIFDFVYILAAIILTAGIHLFLKKTRLGQAAMAVGQNPRGAKIVGINVNRTYIVIFGIGVALIGSLGGLFLARHSIGPHIGFQYTLKAFCIIAMAGIGNIPGVVSVSLLIGISEKMIKSIPGYGHWEDVVYFALIIIVLLKNSKREAVR